MMSKERQQELYDRAGNSSAAWYMTADSLLAATKILLKNFDPSTDLNVGDIVPDESKIYAPIFPLYGFALENLFKALWVKNGNKIVEQGKYIGIPNTGDHNLHELADAVGFDLSDQERDSLIRLSTIMTSNGRYPIAKDWASTKIQRYREGGYGPKNLLSGSILSNANTVINRICKVIGF